MPLSTKKNYISKFKVQNKTKKLIGNNKHIDLQNNKINLLKEKAMKYDDMISNYFLRRSKLITEIKECKKHYNILNNGKTFIGLQKYSFLEDSTLVFKTLNNHYHSIINYFDISISKLSQLSSILLKEWAYVHSFSQVFYRKKYNLLYSIPKKKISIINNFFPDIRNDILRSFQNDRKKNINKIWYPHINQLNNKHKSAKYFKKRVRFFIMRNFPGVSA